MGRASAHTYTEVRLWSFLFIYICFLLLYIIFWRVSPTNTAMEMMGIFIKQGWWSETTVSW